MQKAILTMLIIFITVCGTVSETAAGDGWITGGLGLATKGLAYASDVSVLISKDKIISVRITGATGESSFGGGFLDHPRESVYDIGILIGTLNRTHSASASFSIGPSFVSSVHRGELISRFFYSDTFEKISKKTIGVSFQTQVMWRYCGFMLFGNYNSARSFAGVTLNIRFWL